MPFVENCVQALRRLERLIGRHSKIVLVGAVVAQAAAAQGLQHGTYFIAAITTDYVVVAIDSRLSIDGVARHSVNDGYCKIRPLSSNSFFFASGIIAAVDTNSRIFDAGNIARDVYGQFNTRMDNFDYLSESWAIQMENTYKSNFSLFPPNSLVAHTMIKGFFVGTDNEGNIAVSGATIKYQPLPGFPLRGFSIISEHVVPSDPEHASLLYEGYSKIIEEITDAESERAKKTMAEPERKIVGRSKLDAVAIRLASYAAAVRDWSGDPTIGGKIAVVILERGKDWRWFQRPDSCPDNSKE